MADRVVMDSSAIAAIFFWEKASEVAEDIAKENFILTVDLALIEVANVAWKRYRFVGEDMDTVIEAFESCREFITEVCEVVSSVELLEEALNIALQDGITVYDALFVAASVKKSAELVTTDRRLFEAVKDRIEVKLIG